MTNTTAVIPFTMLLLSPLHHGAGTFGNSQISRIQEIMLPDGTTTMVPFVSGNSLRHAIRCACAETTLSAIAAKPGELSRPVVDLLYSGGALTSSDTAQIDLETHRALDALWPPAGLLGYSGRGQIWAGSLYVDHLHLVCAENAWRMPEPLRSHPHAVLSAAALRDEDFGTRHDPIGTSADRWLPSDLWMGPTGRPTQMIYDWQVIKAGATMYGTLRLAAATDMHAQALQAAWKWLTADGTLHLGAKRAQGYGLCQADVDWSKLPEFDPGWVTRLGRHRDELMRLLVEAAGK